MRDSPFSARCSCSDGDYTEKIVRSPSMMLTEAPMTAHHAIATVLNEILKGSLIQLLHATCDY
jgi:hypothetical protein